MIDGSTQASTKKVTRRPQGKVRGRTRPAGTSARGTKTARKLRETSAVPPQPARDQYANLYEFAPVGYLTLDQAGCITKANLAGARILRRSKDSIQRQPLLDFISRRDRRKYFRHLALCRRHPGERLSTELWLESENDAPRACMELISASIAEDDQDGPGFRSVIIDITERKQMEAAIAQASRLVGENPPPVLRLHEGRIVSFSNRSAQRVLRRWGVGLGEEAPTHIKRAGVVALEENAKQYLDLPLGRKTFQVLFVPVREGGYVNLYFSDITERLRAETALRRAHRELEKRVAQRTRELTSTNRALEAEIATRKEMEDVLRESRERFRLVIESSRDYAIFMLDPEGRVASWNESVKRIKGYGAKEILGRHFSCFYPKADVQDGKPSKMLETARTQGRAEDEGWRVRKNGSRFWASVLLTAVYDEDGQLRGFSKVTRDITERWKAQRALRLSEMKLADFFNHSPFGLLWIGPTGRIQNANQAWLDLVGCRLEESLNQPLRNFCVEAAIVNEALHKLAQHGTLHSCRAQLRHRDGTTRHVLIDANGLWEGDRMVHSRWFVRDITRRVNLEREVSVVAERERERIGRDLHDDLCQQLTGIEFLSQTLARQLAVSSPDHSERAREIAGMVRSAITNTRELAHGLSPMEMEDGGLEGALQELAARTRKIYKIDCRFYNGTPHLDHSPALGMNLYRIAQEALTNALKHGHPQSVEIRLRNTKRRLVLTVTDDGIGFPSRPRKGKGMGLRVMRYRASVIGGTFTVEPNPTGGTVVSCALANDTWKP